MAADHTSNVGIFDRAPDRTSPDRGAITSEAPRTGAGGPKLLARLDWAAAFFGWLVVVMVAVLLSVLLSGIAVLVARALGRRGVLVVNHAAVQQHPWVASVAAAMFCAVLLIAYYTGGYVAGRMSPSQGGKRGLGVWTMASVALGGSASVVLHLSSQRHLVDRGALSTLFATAGTRGLVWLLVSAAILVVCLLAAVAGAGVGCRYHRRLDAELVSRSQRRAALSPMPPSAWQHPRV